MRRGGCDPLLQLGTRHIAGSFSFFCDRILRRARGPDRTVNTFSILTIVRRPAMPQACDRYLVKRFTKFFLTLPQLSLNLCPGSTALLLFLVHYFSAARQLEFFLFYFICCQPSFLLCKQLLDFRAMQHNDRWSIDGD